MISDESRFRELQRLYKIQRCSNMRVELQFSQLGLAKPFHSIAPISLRRLPHKWDLDRLDMRNLILIITKRLFLIDP